MARKSASERLIEEQKKLEQQKNKVATLEKQAKNDERKKRTKRLIEVGALTTKYFADDNVLEPDAAKIMLDKICAVAAVKTIIHEVFPPVRENESKDALTTTNNASH